jgi:primary-amine oxidase
MAAAAQEFAQTPDVPQRHSVAHPLCPLSGDEISAASTLIQSIWPSNADLRFKVVTLDEPAKKQLLPYLEAEHSGSSLPSIDRKVFTAYYIRNTVSLASRHHHSTSNRRLRIASMKPL